MALSTIALSTKVKLNVQLIKFIKVFKQERNLLAINNNSKKDIKTYLELIYIDYQFGKQE